MKSKRKFLVIAALLAVLAGCCTSSYFESLVTLGIGAQYCGKNWTGDHRCMKPGGHQDSGCHCSADSACRGGGRTGKGCCMTGE